MEKYRKVEVKLGKPNVETLTSKGLKLTDVMKVKKINVLSQETRWKKTRGIGGGLKLFYYAMDG